LKNLNKSVDNTGFGSNANAEGGRLTNRDGTTNLRKVGLPFLERLSLYHALLRLPRLKFLFLVFGVYTIINILFATVYVLVGIEHLKGTEPSTSIAYQFQQAFFFSSQTLTTVGYGHISPSGLIANIVASLESFTGIMSFALVTGLFFSRFSRPKAYLIFSDQMIIAPYKEGRALMLRFASKKNNHLTDAEAELTSAFHIPEGGKVVTKFFRLPIEISKINSLALSWTLVHPIDEQSPFWGLNEEELMQTNLEVIVGVKAFDDHYSNIVQQRTSYTAKELIFGAKFIPIYERSADGQYTVLHLDQLNRMERVAL
jgi:inward rectifier potassium channel